MTPFPLTKAGSAVSRSIFGTSIENGGGAGRARDEEQGFAQRARPAVAGIGDVHLNDLLRAAALAAARAAVSYQRPSPATTPSSSKTPMASIERRLIAMGH